MTIHYAAFDPGKDTGYAFWGKEGNPLYLGIARELEELYKILREVDNYPRVIIWEKYQSFPWKSGAHNNFKQFEASQAIGAISSKASEWGSRKIEQPSSILNTAFKWTGQCPRGDHLPIHSKCAEYNHKDNHHIIAFNHGEYFLIQNKIKSHRLANE